MKLFNLHILKQKTLDDMCKGLAEDRVKACRESAKRAVIIPNKMISRLLAKQADKPMVKQLLDGYLRLKSECNYLREKVRNV